MPYMGSIVHMDPKHPEVVGTCPGHHLRPIAQNNIFKSERPGIPLKLLDLIAVSLKILNDSIIMLH